MKKTVTLVGLLLSAFALHGVAQSPAPAGRPGASQRAANPDFEMPRPMDAPDTVFIEDMTWLEVRDAMRAGKRTVLVATGGVEQNGPYLVTGKHNVILRGTTEAIARKLGNALVAPIVAFVPEGNLDPPSSHMRYPGSISLTADTFKALLRDIALSLKAHGFEHIVFIGDSGGNQRGQQVVADRLNTRWKGKPLVAHIPEYYDNPAIQKYLVQIGVTKPDQPSDNVHDEPMYTFPLMVVDPRAVRWAERVQIGKASIDSVSIADKEKAIEIGRKIVDFHATATAALIKKAIAGNARTGARQ
jgi:creatinine amidohydrolase/Fe(II)-dependent formamide hydrolase-like protein